MSYNNIILSGDFVQFVAFTMFAMFFLWRVVSWVFSLKDRNNNHIRKIAQEEIRMALLPIKEELSKLRSSISNSNDLTRQEITRTNELMKEMMSVQKKTTEQIILTNQCIARIEERLNNVQNNYERLSSR